MAPNDESAGPLLVDYLYEAGNLKQRLFSFLPTRSKRNRASIVFGDYQKENDEPNFYDGEKNKIVAHRIGGSFHWAVQQSQYCVGETCFTPTVHNALTDTGTSMIVMQALDVIQTERAICLEAERSGYNCKTDMYGYSFIPNCNAEVLKKLPLLRI